MTSELHDLMDDLEVALVATIDRLEEAERARLYVDVLEHEQRLEALHDALALVAEALADGSPLSAD